MNSSNSSQMVPLWFNIQSLKLPWPHYTVEQNLSAAKATISPNAVDFLPLIRLLSHFSFVKVTALIPVYGWS